jgi:RNA polymerase sigma factor (sigma-70 family)
MTTTQTDADVYRDHALELTRYATVLVGPDDATDIVTDAVLRSFASPNWRTVENRRAYLYRAVLNHANSFHRSTSRRRRRENVVALRSSSAVVDAEPSIDALAALRTLSSQQRAVIYLSYWEDQTAADIAALLDISEGSVRKQLARGREQLRKAMAS